MKHLPSLAVACALIASPLTALNALTLTWYDTYVYASGTATIKSSGDCKFSQKIENASFV